MPCQSLAGPRFCGYSTWMPVAPKGRGAEERTEFLFNVCSSLPNAGVYFGRINDCGKPVLTIQPMYSRHDEENKECEKENASLPMMETTRKTPTRLSRIATLFHLLPLCLAYFCKSTNCSDENEAFHCGTTRCPGVETRSLSDETYTYTFTFTCGSNNKVQEVVTAPAGCVQLASRH